MRHAHPSCHRRPSKLPLIPGITTSVTKMEMKYSYYSCNYQEEEKKEGEKQLQHEIMDQRSKNVRNDVDNVNDDITIYDGKGELGACASSPASSPSSFSFCYGPRYFKREERGEKVGEKAATDTPVIETEQQQQQLSSFPSRNNPWEMRRQERRRRTPQENCNERIPTASKTFHSSSTSSSLSSRSLRRAKRGKKKMGLKEQFDEACRVTVVDYHNGKATSVFVRKDSSVSIKGGNDGRSHMSKKKKKRISATKSDPRVFITDSEHKERIAHFNNANRNGRRHGGNKAGSNRKWKKKSLTGCG